MGAETFGNVTFAGTLGVWCPWVRDWDAPDFWWKQELPSAGAAYQNVHPFFVREGGTLVKVDGQTNCHQTPKGGEENKALSQWLQNKFPGQLI